MLSMEKKLEQQSQEENNMSKEIIEKASQRMEKAITALNHEMCIRDSYAELQGNA